jgi:Domain of unknown function (DUF4276)
MRRLHVVVEGGTEFNFVQRMLKPHLERVLPAHFVSAVRRKEGFTYAGVQKDVRRLLGGPGSQVVVTTMIDLYRIPAGFPGLRESEDDPSLERVRKIEGAFAREIDDARFIPYIQLHEFEALVLCGLSALEERYPHRRQEIRELEKRINRQFRSPEEVDRFWPPSRRLLQAIPGYAKIVDGIHVVESLGIAALRQKCLHFGEWLEALERVLVTER